MINAAATVPSILTVGSAAVAAGGSVIGGDGAAFADLLIAGTVGVEAGVAAPAVSPGPTTLQDLAGTGIALPVDIVAIPVAAAAALATKADTPAIKIASIDLATAGPLLGDEATADPEAIPADIAGALIRQGASTAKPGLVATVRRSATPVAPKSGETTDGEDDEERTASNAGGDPVQLPTPVPAMVVVAPPAVTTPPPILPTTRTVSTSAITSNIARPVADAPAPPAPSAQTAATTPPAPTTDALSIADPIVSQPAAPTPATPATLATRGGARDDMAVAQPTAPQAAPLRIQPAVPAPLTGSAAQVFGAAIVAAVRPERPERVAQADPSSPIVSATPVAAPATIAATADAQQAPLDLTQHRWPHAMIDRIEQLRDAAGGSEARIRLVPDALGSIDVSVKQDGGVLTVHFSAEQSATRALLVDAQPRLAAAAEERGLRLGQTAVDGGGSGQQQQARTPAQQTQPLRNPAGAGATDTPANDASDDARVA